MAVAAEALHCRLGMVVAAAMATAAGWQWERNGCGGDGGATAWKPLVASGNLTISKGRMWQRKVLSGVGTDGRLMMVIWNGRCKAVGVGWRDDQAAHIQQREQGQRRR